MFSLLDLGQEQSKIDVLLSPPNAYETFIIRQTHSVNSKLDN